MVASFYYCVYDKDRAGMETLWHNWCLYSSLAIQHSLLQTFVFVLEMIRNILKVILCMMAINVWERKSPPRTHTIESTRKWLMQIAY